MARTDEIYDVHERMADLWQSMIKKLVIEVGRDDEDAKLLLKGVEFLDYKDPCEVHDKAIEHYASRFADVEVRACAAHFMQSALALSASAALIVFVVGRVLFGWF